MLRRRAYAFGGGGGDNPVFKTQAEHDAYYRKMLIEKAKVERPAAYSSYLGEPSPTGSPNTDPLDENTLIALMGGIPQFHVSPTTKQTFNGANSRIKDIRFDPLAAEGYRYNQEANYLPNKGLPDAESITKRAFGGKMKYAMGGPRLPYDVYDEVTPGKTVYDNISGGFDIKGGFEKTLPYLSNISNSFSRLPTPPSPILEQTVNPSLVNFDADRNELDRTFRGISKGLGQSSPNPGLANSQRVSTLGKVLEAKGRLSQQEGNINAGIKNQTNQVNANINARNVERGNSFQEELTARRLKQQQLQQANLADVTNKAQLSRRDQDLMDLENRKLGIVYATSKDTGTFDRNLYDNYLKELYPARRKRKT